MTDLGTPGGNYSQGKAINRRGQVAGWADTKRGAAESFLWNGKITAGLAALSTSGINDSGQVAGTCGNSPGQHACLDSNGKMTDFGLNFFPAAVNDNGVVVGGDLICNGGTLRNLTSLIPAGSPSRSSTPTRSTTTARSSPTPITPPPTRPAPYC